jgi:hypothetical protein
LALSRLDFLGGRKWVKTHPVSKQVRSIARNPKTTSKSKNQNGKSKFKDGFKKRVYEFALDVNHTNFFTYSLKSAFD